MNRYIITVPANKQSTANDAVRRLNGGGDAFVHGLIPAAQNPAEPPATHYVANWQMTEADFEKVKAALDGAGVNYKVWTMDRPDPAKGKPTFDEVLAEEALKRIPRDDSSN